MLLEEILGLLVLPLLTKLKCTFHRLYPGSLCTGVELGLCFFPGPAGLSSGPFQQRISSVLFEALHNLKHGLVLLLPPPGKRVL